MRPRVHRWKGLYGEGQPVCVSIYCRLSGLFSASFVTEAKADSCSIALPQHIAERLSAKFPGWRTKRVSDLLADDHALWMHAHPKECPGAATGHFKDSKAESYAVLLLRKSDPSTGYKLIVVSGNDDFDLLDHSDTGVSSGMVISRLKPGKYSDFEETESIAIKLDSINVEWIEAAAVLYYWNSHKFRTLQTSD